MNSKELMKMFSHLPNHLVSPVWHMSLPINWLLELADNFPRFCFGSSGKYWQVGSYEWEQRCDLAFNSIAKNGQVPYIHMLRGLNMAGKRWPFASADSVNVARNYKDKDKDPEKMARAIDSIQSPLQWDNMMVQKELAV